MKVLKTLLCERSKPLFLAKIFTIGISLLFVLTGCSKVEKSSDKIIIRYNNPENLPELINLMNDTIQAFESENPDIKIYLETGSGNPMKIITQMAGGTAPDVFFWWLNPDVLIDKNQLLPLNKYIQKYNVALSDYYAQAVEFMSKGDEVYGLPIQFKDISLVYNKDIFDKDGLGYPNEEWDWDTFYHTARTLTKDFNGDGRRDQFGSQDFWGVINVLIKLNNGHIFDFEKGRSLLLEDARTQESIKYYKKLFDDACPTTAEAEGIGMTGGGGVNAFISGRIGMFICWNYLIRTIALSKDLNWDVSPIPKAPDGIRRQIYEVGGLCISRQTRYPEEAFRFVKFYCGEKGMKIFAKARNGLPAHKEVSRIFLAGPPPGMKYFAFGLENALRLSERSDVVKLEIKEEILDLFRQEYELYMLNEISFEEFLTNASKKMESKFKVLTQQK